MSHTPEEQVIHLKGILKQIREGLIEDGYQEINVLVELCDEGLEL